MSIEWRHETAPADEYCSLCAKLIRNGWSCLAEDIGDHYDNGDPVVEYYHPECMEVTDSWTTEQWEDYWDGSMDIDAIGWPQYDEQGNVVAQADPPCVSCGSPRSQGCEDPTACGVAALPFSQHCDATRDCNDYVCVQDVRSLIPPERWPELERLHMLEVHECGRCNGHGKYPGRTRSCPECGGTGKQIIAGGVG